MPVAPTKRLRGFDAPSQWPNICRIAQPIFAGCRKPIAGTEARVGAERLHPSVGSRFGAGLAGIFRTVEQKPKCL
jgi:hypothetical protein